MKASKQVSNARANISASGADLRGTKRINFNHINSFSVSLVGNESLQLIETPVVNPVVESFSSLTSPDSLQVFHYNSSFCNTINNLFTDIVVYPSLETSLSSRPFHEKLSGRPSAFGLKLFPQSLELEHFSFDSTAPEEFFIRGNSHMIHSDINTNFPVATSVDVDVFGKCDMNKHSLLFIKKNLSSLPRPVKVFNVIFRDLDRDIYSSVYCSYSNFIRSECKSSLVKVKRHVSSIFGLRSSRSIYTLEVLGSYSNGIYNILRWQFKFLSGFMITKMVKVISFMSIGFKTHVRDVRNSFGIFLHGLNKKFIIGDFQFYCSNRFHSIYKDLNYLKLRR